MHLNSNPMNKTKVNSPCDEFAFPRPIHEGSELLNEVVETLGALVEELVHKLAGLAEVRQLVEVAVILGVGGGDHLEKKISNILDVFLKNNLFCESFIYPIQDCARIKLYLLPHDA